jgi:hypothetical protein
MDMDQAKVTIFLFFITVHKPGEGGHFILHDRGQARVDILFFMPVARLGWPFCSS